jgi:hypothetical protein
MTSPFSFTEHEKDLILLGVSQITRSTNGIDTTYNINIFGSSSYVYTIIRERLTNGKSLDIHALYTTYSTELQTTYPQVYALYTSTNTTPQTITATTHYVL